MNRTCRACGRVAVLVVLSECACGEPYGKVTFGLDTDNVPWQTDSEQTREARFATELDQARRDRIRDLASQPRDE